MSAVEGFEWDEQKSKRNLLKHGIAFSTAARVFADPFMRQRIDDREDYGEERWLAVGAVGGRILLVTHTY